MTLNLRSKSCVFLIVGLLLLAGCAPAKASLITLDFSADLSFERDATVAAGGIEAEDVIDEIYGSAFGSLGTVSIIGSLTYESSTHVFQQNAFATGASAANYLMPITALQLTIGGSTVNADMPLINGSSPSGLFVTGVSAGGFCHGGAVNAPCGAVPNVQTVNAGLVLDDSDVQIVGPGGAVEFTTRDTIAFVLGGAVVSPEFTPAWNTDIVGDVHVEGVFFGVVGNTGENLWDSTALPNSPTFFNPERIDATVLSLAFAGPNLISPLVLEGEASRLDVSATPSPAPIPEPSSLMLVSGSVLLLAGRRCLARSKCSRSS
ncbi:MAG: hypothetical protein ACRD7E_30255 [Bryobacteraceae bacterium]